MFDIFGDIGQWLTRLLYSLPGILIGLVFHELAHAAVAVKLGDPTPRMMGRLTLNPLAHLDPVGSLMILFAGFGWAKPVITNPSKYRIKRFGYALVGFAGPFTNFLIASVFLFLYLFLATRGIMGIYHPIMQIIINTAGINYVLMIFNLIPIPPLDGYNILKDTLLIRFVRPQTLWNIERYGQFILLALVFLGGTSRIIGTISDFFVRTGIQLFDLIFR